MLLCAAVMLCAVAIYNRFPVLYPDSIAYLLYGDNLVDFHVPMNDRPVFYGLAVWPLHLDISLWPIVLAQGLVVAHLIRLTLRCVGAALGDAGFLAVIAVLAATTPLSWHVSFIMPDIFTGVAILGLFLLGCCADRLSTMERRYCSVLTGFAIIFHLTHLAIAAALLALAALLWLRQKNLRRWLRPLAMALPTGVAVAVAFVFALLVFHTTSLNANGPPFLLSRLLSDGPAVATLRETCPTNPRFVLCDRLDRLNNETWKLLWQPGSPLRKGPDFDADVVAQAGPLVRATILAHPLWVAQNAALSSLQQLGSIASEFAGGPSADFVAFWEPYAVEGFGQSRQLLNEFPLWRLAQVNRFHSFIYALASLAALVIAEAMRHRGQWRLTALAAFVAVGLVANAIVVGVFSYVVGRYQGRVSWLVVLLLIAQAVVWWRDRRKATPPSIA